MFSVHVETCGFAFLIRVNLHLRLSGTCLVWSVNFVMDVRQRNKVNMSIHYWKFNAFVFEQSLLDIPLPENLR